MHRDQAGLKDEIARQDASLAEAIHALHAVALDTEVAVSTEWFTAIDEAAPRATTLQTPLNSGLRC